MFGPYELDREAGDEEETDKEMYDRLDNEEGTLIDITQHDVLPLPKDADLDDHSS